MSKKISIILLVSVFSIFLYSLSLAQAERKELTEPYISISPDYFYPFEEILYIEGRAEAGAIVTTVLQKQGEKPIKFTIKTDSLGEWVVAEKTYLSSGNWEVRARQQAGRVVSDWSNPRVIRSVATGVNIFGLNVRYAVIAIIVFIFLAVVLSIFFYFRKKIRRLKRQLIDKRLMETEEKIHKGFAEIRRDLLDDLKQLSINAQNRPLTADEIERRNHLLEEIDKLERGLGEDIDGIEDNY